MPAILMNCEAIAEKYFSQVKAELEQMSQRPRVKMFLATFDEGSESYSWIMRRRFEAVGIDSILERVGTPADLERKILATATDDEITGCFVFYPIRFPEIEDYQFMKMVPAHKDVEGLSAENVYRLIHYRKTFEGTPCKAVVPCTPKAVIKLLAEYGIPIKGCDVVIVNKSYSLGAPLRRMFDNLGATVTACDINTKSDSLKHYVRNADIVVTAVPVEVELFDEADVKPGATIINCSFVNNFDVERVSEVAGHISYRQGKNYIGQITTAMAAVNVGYLMKYKMFQEKSGALS
ncbi:MAG: bifunctional 5,10-methylenetetrahydrofolate dehydrogenase/5,10-methenyltetrahydrofolate cyclohydrolase [Nanoarchaeota archaeon]